MLGTDKAADAFKEFQIKFFEGDKAMINAIEHLTGDSWNMFIDEVQAGDTTVAEVFDLMLAKLQETEDQFDRNRLGVSLMGNQFEDLGDTIGANLSLSGRQLDEMAGKADQVGGVAKTLGEQWDIAFRQLLVGLEPAAQELMPLLSDGIKAAGNFLVEARPVFEGFAEDLSNTVGPAMLLIEDAAVRIGQALGHRHRKRPTG